MIGNRLRAGIVKEALALLRDRRARILLFAPPIIQLVIFAFASTMDVENASIGVRDLDGGRWSSEIIARFAATPAVGRVVSFGSDEEAHHAIDERRVVAVIRFDENISGDLAAGKPAVIGAIYDGRRSNAVQVLDGFLREIVGAVGAESIRVRSEARPQTIVRHLYNPNLEQLWYVMPALVTIIAAISVLALVTQSVARETELGTFDQLRVSPLRPHEILVAKMVPSLTVGLTNVTLFVILLPTVFGIPLTGSLVAFFMALIVYLLALTGIGLFISCLASTQQQAFVGMIIVAVPMIILSGYAGPIDNMPRFLQVLSWFNPVAWFLEISHGTFLKNMPVADVAAKAVPIAAIATFSLLASTILFRARLN